MTSSLKQRWFGFVLTMAIACPAISAPRNEAMVIDDARHLQVFGEKGRFAGWPANNGIWQWGNEILVGFSLGSLAPQEKQGLHQIDPAHPQSLMLARSLDGGESWSVSDAGYPDGEPKPFPTNIAFGSTS